MSMQIISAINPLSLARKDCAEVRPVHPQLTWQKTTSLLHNHVRGACRTPYVSHSNLHRGLMTKITTQAAEPSMHNRTLPWPILEARNDSWPNGAYHITYRVHTSGQSMELQHRVTGTPLIQTWIDTQQVSFVCTAAAPRSMYRQLHISATQDQVIEWCVDDLGEIPWFTPMLVARRALQHTVTLVDGLSEHWIGHTLHLPRGARIAVGQPFICADEVTGWMNFHQKQELAPGSFFVAGGTERDFTLHVYLASDLHHYLHLHRQSLSCHNIMTNILTAGLTLLQQEYQDEADWSSHRNLQVLTANLADAGLPHWADDDFQPELVASILHPYHIPKEDIWSELDDTAYLKLQRQLTTKKDGELQRAFLEAALDTATFVDFVHQQAPPTSGTPIPLCTGGPWTELTAKDPPLDLEVGMYELWQAIPPRVACRVPFWAQVSLAHIAAGIIDPTWWAGHSKSIRTTGRTAIIQALTKTGTQGDAQVDTCVRNLLRRMSGLPVVRGPYSVFTNCLFARAWWREHLVSNIRNYSQQQDKAASRTELRDILRYSQDYWENLVSMTVPRGAVFGTRVQAVFIDSLARHNRSNPYTPLRKAYFLRKVLQQFSNVAAAREMGVLSFAELSTEVDAFLSAAVEHGS